MIAPPMNGAAEPQAQPQASLSFFDTVEAILQRHVAYSLTLFCYRLFPKMLCREPINAIEVTHRCDGRHAPL